MAIKIVTVSNQVTVGLGRFAASFADKQDLLKIIGNGQMKSIAQNFRDEGAPGAPWPPLSEASKSWNKYTPGHKLLIASGNTYRSIRPTIEGNSVIIGSGTKLAVIQFLGFDGTQSVKPYSYSRRVKSRDKFAQFKIVNKAGKQQTVRRKTVSGVTTVNVHGFSRHIRIPARNPLVFRPEDPARIQEEVNIWAAQQASAAGLETS
jgi:phage gpG-like protein